MDIFEALSELTLNKNISSSDTIVQSIVGSTYITIFAINFTAGMLANVYLCFKTIQRAQQQDNLSCKKSIYAPLIILSFLHCTISSVQFFELDSAISSLWGRPTEGCLIIRQLRTANLFAVPFTMLHASWFLYRVICKHASQPKDLWPTAVTLISTLIGVATLIITLIFNTYFVETSTIGAEIIYSCSRFRNDGIGDVVSHTGPFVGYIITVLIYVWFYASFPLCRRSQGERIRVAGCFVDAEHQLFPLCYAWKGIVIAYLLFWAPFWIVRHIASLLQLPRFWKLFYSVTKLFSNFTSFAQAIIAIRALSRSAQDSVDDLDIQQSQQECPGNSALMALSSQANALSTWVKTEAMSGRERKQRKSSDGDFLSSEAQRRKIVASRQLDAIIFGDSSTEEEHSEEK